MAADAAVEITLIASTAAKQVLGAAVSPSLPLSSAVRTGSLVFLSGVLGNTDANARDLAGQTREVFARIRRTLDAAGLSFPHVVDNTIYLPDLSHQQPVDEILHEVFPSDPAVADRRRRALVARHGLIEMMMTAAVGSGVPGFRSSGVRFRGSTRPGART